MTELTRAEVTIGGNDTEFQNMLARVQRDMQGVGKRMQRAGRTLTTRVTLPILGIATAAGRASSQFETAMTGVAKTVDAPASEIARLGEEFKALSEEIPVSTTELARIGELAGQLGIETRNIRSFTETIAAIGVSTNLSADQAATSLARMSNIMGTAQTDVDRLGATIVDLGNNLATTEAEITQFALRIAGAGEIAGLTESDVLAIGGALSSVGIQAEAGGTAVQKALIQMNTAVAQGNEELEVFAQTAGMTAEQFSEEWEQRPARAFQAFIEGLRRAGDDAATILQNLFSRNQRLTRAFLALSNAGDLLGDAIDRGSEAWEANTALTREAENFYDRLGARFESLRNKLVNVTAELGDRMRPTFDALIDRASRMLDSFRDLEPATVKFGLALAGVAATIGPLLIVVGSLARAVNSLTTAFVTLKGVQIATAVSGWASAFVGLAVQVRSVAGAFALLQVAMGPAGWLMLGIGAAVTALATFTDVFDDLWQGIKNVAGTIRDEFNRDMKAMGVIGERIGDALAPVFDALEEAMDDVAEAAARVVEQMWFITGPLKAIKDLLDQIDLQKFLLLMAGPGVHGIVEARKAWVEYRDSALLAEETIQNLDLVPREVFAPGQFARSVIEPGAFDRTVEAQREVQAATAETSDAVQELINALQDEVDQLRFSERELLKRELALEGATEAERKQALALFDKARALEDIQDRMREFRQSTSGATQATAAFANTLIGLPAILQHVSDKAREFFSGTNEAAEQMARAIEKVKQVRQQAELEKMRESMRLLNDMADRMARGFVNAFESIADGSKSVVQAIGEMVTNIIAELARLQAQKMFAQFFSGLLSGLGPSQSFDAPGIQWTAPHQLEGFAQGGRFAVAGAGGVDSQLVQFMATPGETVTVDPNRGSDRGGGRVMAPQVNINLSAVDDRSIREKMIQTGLLQETVRESVKQAISAPTKSDSVRSTMLSGQR